MHKEFADWYRAASVVPPQDLLAARWSGIEDASKGLTAERVLDLVQLFAVKPAAGYQVPAFLDTAFREHDESFPTRDNIEELRVLAGAILRQAILRTMMARPVASTYGLSCAGFGVRLASLPTKEHVVGAEGFLVSRSIAVRQSELRAGSNAISRERFSELLPGKFSTETRLAISATHS